MKLTRKRINTSLQDRAEKGQRERRRSGCHSMEQARIHSKLGVHSEAAVHLRLAVFSPARPDQVACSLKDFDGGEGILVSRGFR